ncbi:MAG: ABC transporter permease subunit, partial [Bacillota bacterium]
YAAIMAIGMRSAAYQAEIFRSAISSVAEGEVTAGKSLGLSNMQVFRLIILPQTLRNAIAPWSNEAAIVVKSSSMAFVIGAPELLRQATYVAARTRQPLLMYTVAGVIYLFIVFAFDRVLNRLDERFQIP